VDRWAQDQTQASGPAAVRLVPDVAVSLAVLVPVAVALAVSLAVLVPVAVALAVSVPALDPVVARWDYLHTGWLVNFRFQPRNRRYGQSIRWVQRRRETTINHR
jgi:hypothetical protein